MADQKNRGGQKQGTQHREQSQQKQGTTTDGAGERSDRDKRADQMANPDDTARRPKGRRAMADRRPASGEALSPAP